MRRLKYRLKGNVAYSISSLLFLIFAIYQHPYVTFGWALRSENSNIFVIPCRLIIQRQA